MAEMNPEAAVGGVEGRPPQCSKGKCEGIVEV